MIALPIDAAAAGRTRMPAAPRIAVGQIRTQQTGSAVQRQRQVLDVDVKNPVAETTQELDRIDALPVQMARVEGEAELLPAVQGVAARASALYRSKAIWPG